MNFRIGNSRHRRAGTYGLGALAAALVTIAAIAATAVWAADAIVVSQRNRTFNPNQLTIERGTVVHIINDDRVTHHVYVDASGMTFDSGEQPIGTTVDLRFDKPGRFDVLCAIHPTMRLRITVK
jgi:plastocyanin